jgi:ligand-binding sensor domain-containing protein
MNNRKLCSLLTASLLLAGCSEQPAPLENGADSQQPPPVAASAAPVSEATGTGRPERVFRKVLDNFGVGENVFVRALKFDRANNSLWVGTSVGVHEVSLQDNSLKNTFTREHGLANEYVFAIGIDNQGYKWFGTNAGGASRYKDGQWRTFFPMHGLADYWVYSFASQKNGTFWIGTWAGANRVDPVTGEFTTYLKELINEWVYGMGVDSQDRVWFGTEGGISMFDGNQWQSWNHRDGLGAGNGQDLPASRNTGLGTRSRHDLGVLSGGQATYNPNYVFALHVDPEDVVWAGTWGGGVSRFDGESWTNYTREDGLAGNIVYSMAQDEDGVFWFGTNGGISRFDGRNWRNYGVQEGLPDNNVYSVEVTPNGDVWAGTRGAVVRLGFENRQQNKEGGSE